jgi:hypothetical protein
LSGLSLASGCCVDRVLEYTFYVGVVSLIVGVLLFIVQTVALRLLRASPERVWTLRIWPAVLVAVGIVGLTLPAAVTRFAPIDLGKHESRVDGERHVTLTGWDRKDYSILARMPDVVVLQMANPDVTDQTLGYLAELKSLRELDVAGSQITDAGLAKLTGLSKLQKLIVSRTKVTDSGLGPLLEKLPELKQLDARETGVTPTVLRPWLKAKAGRRALPRVPLEEPPG